MDNLTHTLTGWAMSRAGLNRLGPRATAVVIVAANVPDLDILYFFTGGTHSYMAHHRGWTHSLLGASALGIGVALVFWLWLRRRHAQPHLLQKLMLAGWLGAVSHCLLDWSTGYGIQLLLPFKDTWYALDWVSIIDFWVWAILLAGFAVPALFNLITEEIGGRKSPTGGRWGARVALAAYLLLALGRGGLHADAVAQMKARLYHDRTPIEVGVFPRPFSPFRWRVVVETDATYEAAELTQVGPDKGIAEAGTFYKPPASPALSAALAAPASVAFLSWARFPYAVITKRETGTEVALEDMRYASWPGSWSGYVVRVELDAQNRVVRETTSTRRPD